MRLSKVVPSLSLVAALLVAGCHAPTQEREEFRLTGWFSDYNETIAADFDATVSPYSDEVLLMESFPPGFQVHGLDPTTCAELREKLLEKPYLSDVGACAPVAEDANGDQPVSNGTA